jgi:hypothetical protein
MAFNKLFWIQKVSIFKFAKISAGIYFIWLLSSFRTFKLVIYWYINLGMVVILFEERSRERIFKGAGIMPMVKSFTFLFDMFNHKSWFYTCNFFWEFTCPKGIFPRFLFTKCELKLFYFYCCTLVKLPDCLV